MRPDIILAVITAFCFLLLGILLWYSLSRRLANDRARHELQLRLLQSVGSVEDLTAFMRSEEGRALLGTPTPPSQWPHSDARRYAVRAVKTGVVLLFLGGGMFALFAVSNKDWIVGGILAVTTGVGLLVSAASSLWLSRRMGRQQ